ncbi:MAG: hypothetical protein ACRENH_07870 [Gemmatimonadaceae bacterium]
MRALALVALASACHAATNRNELEPQRAANSATRVRLEFHAASDSFASARDEYEQLWAVDGQRIISALESAASLRFVYAQFADTVISVSVREVASNSGYRDRSGMVLRASYSRDTKKATLMHELGHRLMAGMFTRNEEEHDELFLWLYDAWISLYGKQFADEQVAIEKRRGGPYPKAWELALALDSAQRVVAWKKVLEARLAERR